MSMIGREIIQSRTWDDPKNLPPPHLNYRETFPITVFDAVRAEMNDEKSPTLKMLLDKIFQELENKQPVFAARPANYLMTFAGTPGAVGAIRISKEIPWDPELQSHDKIPTEKAVGDLMYKLGLLDSSGNIIDQSERKVRWADIIGRPLIYSIEGDADGGVMTQKAVTTSLNSIRNSLTDAKNGIDQRFVLMTQQITDHQNNKNNPHAVSLSQIGAVSMEAFESHADNFENPHKTTKYHIGLGKVDNTSDIDKPVSVATQAVLDLINKTLNDFMANTNEANFVKAGSYIRSSGQLILTHNDGQLTVMHIPIDGLMYNGHYDQSTKDFVLTRLSGGEQRVSLDDLFIRYIGSKGSDITIEIDGDQVTGQQKIKAYLNAGSVTGGIIGSNEIPERAYQDGSVSTRALGDLSVTTIKLSDGSVTTEKISDLAVTTSRIATRAVTGRTLFSSTNNNRILGTLSAGSDPIWVQVNEEMMGNSSVSTRALINDSVTPDKLRDHAVINQKLANGAVDTRALNDFAVTNDKITNGTIEGTKLTHDIVLPGSPKIGTRPDNSSDNNQVPDTKWVKDRLWENLVRNENILDRVIDGRTLFTSDMDDRVLIISTRNTDPQWGQINIKMMKSDSVGQNQLVNNSVVEEKIADQALISRHFRNQSVQRSHIADNAIDSQKLWPSTTGNRVLATIEQNTNPVYTQISRAMIANGAIGGDKIEDNSIKLMKLESSDPGFVVMTVQTAGSDPIWGKVRNTMIADRQIDGRTLFTSPTTHRVLTVTPAHGDSPAWTQINGQMIALREINRMHLQEKVIFSEHLSEKAVGTQHIDEWAITSELIKPRAVTGTELFTTPDPNRILAVGSEPRSDPKWMRLTSEMIEDEAITNTKLWPSPLSYRVIGTTHAGKPPEYLMITHNFIVDSTITPSKLINDFVLFGTPELTVRPLPDAKNKQLADTWWVDERITERLKTFDPTKVFGIIDSDMIKDRSILPRHLFSSDIGMRLLGVTAPGEELEFLLVEESMIANGSVTSDKIARDVTLMGAPRIEVRPSPISGDHTDGQGNLIPDVQWVRDRIEEANLNGTGGPSGPPITSSIPPDNSVTRAMLMDRIVNGAKLFTSNEANRVLGILGANTDPQYLLINREMLNDRIIDSKKLMVSQEANRLLGSIKAGEDLEFVTINHLMLDDRIISQSKMQEDSIGTKELINEAVTREKLARMSIVENIHLFDNAVSNQKIQDSAVTSFKIQAGAVTRRELDPDLILPAHTSVASHTDYGRRAVRNTILSDKAPTPSDGQDGDIWIRYL